MIFVMNVDSDISPQTLKAACSTMEQEQSIDEILGLQVKENFVLFTYFHSHLQHIADTAYLVFI